MSESVINSETALALSGQTDSSSGVRYPKLGEDPWAESFYRMMDQLNRVAMQGNAFRCYADDGDPLSVGVRGGRLEMSGSMHQFDGGVLAGLNNNAVNLVWVEIDLGVPVLRSAVESVGWPLGSHLKIARVVTASGVVHSIEDYRGIELWGDRAASRTRIGEVMMVEADSDNVLLVDNSGGVSGGGVIGIIDDPADAPADANALRDDLVINVLPDLRHAVATLADTVNTVVSDMNDLRQKMRDAGVMDV